MSVATGENVCPSSVYLYIGWAGVGEGVLETGGQTVHVKMW